jgi:hypothetical protein
LFGNGEGAGFQLAGQGCKPLTSRVEGLHPFAPI